VVVVVVVVVVEVEVEVEVGVEVVVIGNGIVVTATEVDDVVATITAAAGAEVLTGMFAFTGFRQTNFPATLVQTNGALFVPESAPALEHFCPAFAAESDVTGIAKNSDTNPMATADLKFVFITPLYDLRLKWKPSNLNQAKSHSYGTSPNDPATPPP
jgi:hypothetical protein